MMLRLRPIPALNQAVLLAVGFAILVMIGGTTVWLVARTRAESQQVIYTLDIKEKLSDLQGLIWQTGSDVRGFLLTGNARDRDAFRADVEAVRAALADAKAALAGGVDWADRASLVADLEAAVAAELSQLEKSAAWRERSGLGALSPVPSEEVGQSPTADIRTIITQLKQQERRLLTTELDTLQDAGRLLLMASLFGVSLIVALAMTSVIMVRRSTGQLRAAHKALEETNESLEATVARRTAELRQANEEIQHFAHIVSHDLRSPLVNIMGFTSELDVVRKEFLERLSLLRARVQDDSEEDDGLAREFDEALTFIKGSTTRMDRLIKAILKLTREGRRELRMEAIDMTDLIRTTADGLGYQAQESGASIAIEPLPSCIGDRLALEQIFANLLENALKYLREGTPGQVRVTGRATPTELIYEVHDNGRGIEAKDLERIFEIFRRSGPQDRSGEGIGLTYVRNLVRRLGGTITVHSELGRGSTFAVKLPHRTAIEPPETSV